MAESRNTPTVVFDISRMISRVGHGHPTGIDRVERAYLEHFLHAESAVIFLVRFGRQAALLNRGGMRQVYQGINNGDLQGQVQKNIRRTSLSWPFLVRGLKAHVPDGFTYLNVGHGKLSPSLWPKLRGAGAGKIVAMIHDLIPIDFPQFTTRKVSENFETRMRGLAGHADYFIYNSTETERRMRPWLAEWKNKVAGQMILLGTDALPRTARAENPAHHPYFVCLSTIEPRKNHRLLLDIWRDFHRSMPEQDIPHLHIIGRRGWMNKDVFDELDNAEFMGQTVFEHADMHDGDLGALMQGSTALLFPSFAEGFGYPLVEALQMQVPVICSSLPSFREIAGDAPTYICTQNQSKWSGEILRIATSNANLDGSEKNAPKLPKWDTHFHKIDTILDKI